MPVLIYLLPKGLRRARDYGLLRGNCSKLWQRIQLMLAVAGAVFPMVPEVKRALATRCCPCCHQPIRFMGINRSSLENSRPTSLKTPISNIA